MEPNLPPQQPGFPPHGDVPSSPGSLPPAPPYQGAGQPAAGYPYTAAQPPYPSGPSPYPGGLGQPAPKTNTLAIVAFVLSFFTGFVAVLLGVIALRQNWVRALPGNGFAWAGIIIGAIGGVVGSIILMVTVWIVMAGSAGG